MDSCRLTNWIRHVRCCALIVLAALSIAPSTSLGARRETAENGRASSGSSSATSQRRLQCIFDRYGIEKRHATEAAAAMSKAFAKAGLTRAQMSDTALMHFLSFSIGETGAGKYMTEISPQSRAKTGFGYLQITGQSNLTRTAACMNQIDPGSGKGVATNPHATIGARAKDKYKAALASVCFWRTNISMNGPHRNASNGSDQFSSEKMLRILGGGSLRGQIFDRAKGRSVASSPREVSRRYNIFKKVQGSAARCGG